MDEKKNIETLFQQYLDNQCSPDEIRVLLNYFEIDENGGLLRKLIQKESNKSNDTVSYVDRSLLLDTTLKRIKSLITTDGEHQEILKIPFYKQFWFRACAAAVIIFFIAFPAYYFLNQKSERSIAHKENIYPIKDIQPGSYNAVLTLSNGKQILLDSAANGTLAQQGNMKVVKINGQVVYTAADGTSKGNPVYNTITTAKANEYQLILADGSKVWLNAASSIHFPASFSGNERKVEITGEAYFEVAHDRSKPFKVEFSNATGEKGEIEVLGTHFDVNAYPDEEAIKTTLLQGSVEIKRADKVQILSPGQQAMLTGDAIRLKKDVDVLQVTAWKDGYFLFNNTDIQTIMREVERWYDVEVNFEGKIPTDGFTGKISRNVPLSKFLKILELNDVHVKKEGRKITIT